MSFPISHYKLPTAPSISCILRMNRHRLEKLNKNVVNVPAWNCCPNLLAGWTYHSSLQ